MLRATVELVRTGLQEQINAAVNRSAQAQAQATAVDSGMLQRIEVLEARINGEPANPDVLRRQQAMAAIRGESSLRIRAMQRILERVFGAGACEREILAECRLILRESGE